MQLFTWLHRPTSPACHPRGDLALNHCDNTSLLWRQGWRSTWNQTWNHTLKRAQQEAAPAKEELKAGAALEIKRPQSLIEYYVPQHIYVYIGANLSKYIWAKGPIFCIMKPQRKLQTLLAVSSDPLIISHASVTTVKSPKTSNAKPTWGLVGNMFFVGFLLNYIPLFPTNPQ